MMMMIDEIAVISVVLVWCVVGFIVVASATGWFVDHRELAKMKRQALTERKARQRRGKFRLLVNNDWTDR
jgi:hypothetical protein